MITIVDEPNLLCSYGCGQIAKYQFKNGKLCCCDCRLKCIATRNRHSKTMKKRFGSLEAKLKMSKIKKQHYKDHPETIVKMSNARRKHYKDPEERKKQSERLKKNHENNPERRKKQAIALKNYYKNNPNAGKRHSRKIKKHYEDNPEAGMQHSKKLSEYWKDPEAKKRQSEIKKIYYKNPEAKGKNSRAQKKRFEDPVARRVQAMALKKYYENPEALIKNSCVQQGIDRKDWTGFKATEPYCDVWGDKEYKQDIKNRDGNVCQNPDCWHKSDRLCVHHIDYKKKNCHPSNLITLCISCNFRANSNREYWKSFYKNIMIKKNIITPSSTVNNGVGHSYGN